MLAFLFRFHDLCELYAEEVGTPFEELLEKAWPGNLHCCARPRGDRGIAAAARKTRARGLIAADDSRRGRRLRPAKAWLSLEQDGGRPQAAPTGEERD